MELNDSTHVNIWNRRSVFSAKVTCHGKTFQYKTISLLLLILVKIVFEFLTYNDSKTSTSHLATSSLMPPGGGSMARATLLKSEMAVITF